MNAIKGHQIERIIQIRNFESGPNVDYRNCSIVREADGLHVLTLSIPTTAGTPYRAIKVYHVPGTYTFTVPTGITSMNIFLQGSGGGGVGTAVSACGGGGGGSLNISNLTVVAGNIFTLTLSAGGVSAVSGTAGKGGNAEVLRTANGGTITFTAEGGYGGVLTAPSGTYGGTYIQPNGVTYTGGVGNKPSLTGNLHLAGAPGLTPHSNAPKKAGYGGDLKAGENGYIVIAINN